MPLRDVDLNLLTVFTTIYEMGSISRAADRLDQSQPAVSNALKRLRMQLDDPLFVRKGNGVAPTRRAEEMIGPIRTALSGLQQSLEGSPAFDLETAKNRFRILIAEPMELVVIPPLAQALARSEGASLELTPPQMVKVETALIDGLIDVAVFLSPGRQEDILSVPLCPFDLVYIVRRGHEVALASDPAPLLQSYGHVSFNLARNAIANTGKVHMWQRHPRREVIIVPRGSAIPPIVARTDLIGVVPRIYAQQICESMDLAIVEPPSVLARQQMFLIWHRRNDADPANRWLRDQIVQAVETEIAVD